MLELQTYKKIYGPNTSIEFARIKDGKRTLYDAEHPRSLGYLDALLQADENLKVSRTNAPDEVAEWDCAICWI